jgi:hypothetical protein
MNESSNSNPADKSQQIKQRLIHSKPVWVDVSDLYAFSAYNAFGSRALNVFKVLHCIVTYLPVKNNKKDISASAWVGTKTISETIGAPKPRVSEALHWLYDHGYLTEVVTSKLRYRAFTEKGIKFIQDYCVNRTGTENVTDQVRKAELTGTETVPNRDNDREKRIDSRGGDAERSAKTTVVESTTAKKATTTNLFRFYGDINKVTGPADAREKNEPFKEALARHGPEGFAYVLHKLQHDKMIFVWDDPVEGNQLHYSCILDVFNDLLRNAKPG